MIKDAHNGNSNGNAVVRSGRNVVIFGGAGFIGSNWAEHLLTSSSSNVHIVDNLSRPGAECNLQWLHDAFSGSHRLRATLGDIRDRDLVRKTLTIADEIYHFAAQVAVTTSIDDPHEDFEINAVGTFNILEAARTIGRKPFLLFTSTNKVYGKLNDHPVVAIKRRYEFRRSGGISEQQPLDFYSPYGCSKGTADQYVHDYARIFDIPAVVVRMSCIAGPRQFGTEDQGWVAHFLYSALRNSGLKLYGDGRQTRDILNIADLLHAFELLRDRAFVTSGNVYNIGGGEANSVSLLELLEEIEDLLGKKIAYSFGPARAGDQLVYVTDFAKLTRHTGWRPSRDVRTTLQDILEWYERNQRAMGSDLPAMQLAGIDSIEPAKAA